MKGLHGKLFVVDIGSMGGRLLWILVRWAVVCCGYWFDGWSMEKKTSNSNINKNGIGSPSLGFFT